MKRILVFDNYDSFTFNLVHLVKQLTTDEVGHGRCSSI
jgi:anthranilate synthase component 2